MRLSEIATDIYIGSEIKNDQLNTGTFPAIKCKDINSKLPLHFTKCISFVNQDLIKIKRYFEHGDILVGKIGDINTSGKAVAYLGYEKCLLGDAVYVVKHNQNPKFLAYFLSTKYVRKQIMTFYKGGVVFNFFIRDIKKIQIPLPSLKEQEEIVSKLDKFRKITEDFEKEIPKLLKLVEKQYEYYKEEILKY